MYFITPPGLAKAFLPGGLWWKVPHTGKCLYLTFDDGPVPEVTLPLLDLLQEAQVKATFFCVGENVFHHYPVYLEILARGHQVGNHTYHHLNGWKCSTSTYLEDVRRCDHLLESGLFRPPHGRIRTAQARALLPNYRIIQWSVLSGDFDPRVGQGQCLQNCLGNLSPGNIYVFHDSQKAGRKMLAVVPEFIKRAKENGFSFATIPTPQAKQ